MNAILINTVSQILHRRLTKQRLLFTHTTQQTVGKETIAFGLSFASVFPSSDILNGYVTNTEANDHVALSNHRNSHLYITFFHVL